MEPTSPAAAPTAQPRRTTVGREAQRTQLRRAYARAAQRHGLVVVVTGEPEIGKTSLNEDLQELAAGDTPPLVARGCCSESSAKATTRWT